ncbi:unnamed protein product [Bemisia tabaci]|uniref:SCP domain-containing protein n=1 Tax=Bemisia tabaci TaxID=7038 RepID=A0A9P0F7H4_BEMTA|nr:unnamed protein product [Bemisia tabaci]
MLSMKSCPFAVTLLLIVLISSCKGDQFADEVLAAHNHYRAAHGVPPLTLDEDLNALAQDWAVHLTQLGHMEHRDSEYGENVYYFWSSDPDYPVSGNDPVDSWYNEVKQYTYGTEGSGTGHFTQVVWKDSQRLGVGIAKSNGHVYVVCNYDPAGNVGGMYAENVLQPNGPVQPLGGGKKGRGGRPGSGGGSFSGGFQSFGPFGFKSGSFGPGSESPLSSFGPGMMKLGSFGGDSAPTSPFGRKSSFGGNSGSSSPFGGSSGSGSPQSRPGSPRTMRFTSGPIQISGGSGMPSQLASLLGGLSMPGGGSMGRMPGSPMTMPGSPGRASPMQMQRQPQVKLQRMPSLRFSSPPGGLGGARSLGGSPFPAFSGF